jgi:hypothetical protein
MFQLTLPKEVASFTGSSKKADDLLVAELSRAYRTGVSQVLFERRRAAWGQAVTGVTSQ